MKFSKEQKKEVKRLVGEVEKAVQVQRRRATVLAIELTDERISHGQTKGKLLEVSRHLEKANRVLTAIRAISDPLKLEFTTDVRVARQAETVSLADEGTHRA